jgi:hypothetical protein
MGATTRDIQQWATNMLKQVEQLQDVVNVFTSHERATEFMDTTYQDIAMQHDTVKDINQGYPNSNISTPKTKGGDN